MDRLEFFNLLCCPTCRDDLLPGESGDSLLCASCGHSYPIVKGIPVLLPPRPKGKKGQERYWDSPGKAALYDKKVEGEGTPFGLYNHRSEIEAMVGFYQGNNLDLVLDAGCGNGRFMETFPKGAISVGADASLNLLAIARRKGRGHHHVCCELEHLPFRSGTFGTVISCRVLQHIQNQEKAVREMGRITRSGGDVILQVYNNWNLKTLYKNIRMSPRWRRIFNYPFRKIFRSMSPFSDWGLAYDRYNSWPELRKWMVGAGLGAIEGRGAGFGYHKYFLQPFYIDALLNRKAPGFLKGYYQKCLQLEGQIGSIPPFRYTLEKIVIHGVAGAGRSGHGFLPKAAKNIYHYYRLSPLFTWRAWRETWRERHGARGDVRPNRIHLTEALDWLRRAQDATPDRGVSRGYCLGWNFHLNSQGWQPAYPETTGYIIPTFFDCAALLKDEHLRRRAVEMADWEIQVQLPNGAVMGGVVTETGEDGDLPAPAVFNTGQVILGWLRAFTETGNVDYLKACNRAGAFLLRNQDPDGAWRRENSHHADPLATTYNARVGWALVLLGRATGNSAFLEAGERNIAFTLSRQNENGWFRDNCLDTPEAPLLHTICYALEGILGAAEALERWEWVDRVRITADALLERMGEDGRLPGRLDDQWRKVVAWDCLTGSSQLAGVWLHLARLTGEAKYRQGAERVLAFIKSTQNLVSEDGGLRGGIKGSFPFSGGYGRFELLNWPAKFFIDALFLQETEDQASS
ncbi:MAG: methyltransferase domain-containing protein [Magnetococcales bacterium]|nr:methyltransferase domain-containing protein [Magnetococcales bacterium]